jgi:hypothetical protein
MNNRTKIIVAGLVTFFAGFVLIKWFLLVGLGLMFGSWFVFDNLWLLPKNAPVPWRKIIKRVAAFAILGLLTDILLRI